MLFLGDSFCVLLVLAGFAADWVFAIGVVDEAAGFVLTVSALDFCWEVWLLALAGACADVAGLGFTAADSVFFDVLFGASFVCENPAK